MNELILKKEIYNQNNIMQAVRDYDAIAEINIIDEKDGCILHFNKSRFNIEKTMKEFENYLIDLSNVRMKC